MPLINKTLCMRGIPITTPGAFHEHFDPGDFLRQRKLASYFALRQLAFLSPLHTYFSEVLRLALNHWSDYDKAIAKKLVCDSQYWVRDPQAGMISGWSHDKTERLLANMEQEPRYQDVKLSVKEIVQQAGLEESEALQLCIMLIAGYMLAGRCPAECPITAQEAVAAFRGEQAVLPEFRVLESGARCYRASEKPYKLKMRTDSTLHFGEKITLVRFEAEPSAQGVAGLSVIFQANGREEHVLPGDYRYASFVGDELIRLYPVKKCNRDRIMERRGYTIFLMDSNGTELATIDCAGRDILDFSPAHGDDGWVILEPGYVDVTGFKGNANGLTGSDIVEVDIDGYDVLQLSSRGEKYKNGTGTGERNLVSMR